MKCARAKSIDSERLLSKFPGNEFQSRVALTFPLTAAKSSKAFKYDRRCTRRGRLILDSSTMTLRISLHQSPIKNHLKDPILSRYSYVHRIEY